MIRWILSWFSRDRRTTYSWLEGATIEATTWYGESDERTPHE